MASLSPFQGWMSSAQQLTLSGLLPQGRFLKRLPGAKPGRSTKRLLRHLLTICRDQGVAEAGRGRGRLAVLGGREGVSSGGDLIDGRHLLLPAIEQLGHAGGFAGGEPHRAQAGGLWGWDGGRGELPGAGCGSGLGGGSRGEVFMTPR